MSAGGLLERFRGDRSSSLSAWIRALAAAGIAVTIATAGTRMDEKQIPMILLFFLIVRRRGGWSPRAAHAGDLHAGDRQSPGELVAANTVWTTGEGLRCVRRALHRRSAHGSQPAQRRRRHCRGRLHGDGSHCSGTPVRARGRCLRREPGCAHAGWFREGGAGSASSACAPWTMLGTFGQVVTRGLLNALTVAAAIELPGWAVRIGGLLTAALRIRRAPRCNLRDGIEKVGAAPSNGARLPRLLGAAAGNHRRGPAA